ATPQAPPTLRRRIPIGCGVFLGRQRRLPSRVRQLPSHQTHLIAPRSAEGCGRESWHPAFESMPAGGRAKKRPDLLRKDPLAGEAHTESALIQPTTPDIADPGEHAV